MKKVITTVGTSIFSNNLHGGDREFVERLKNMSATEKWDEKRERIEELRDKTWKIIKSSKDPKVSAEVQSIYNILEKADGTIKVFLVASDTILSKLAATLVKDWIQKEKGALIKFDNEVHLVRDLSVLDSNKFLENGVQNLIDTILNIREQENNQNEHASEYLLNISGGYKGVIPILTIVGQIYNIPLFYIYEESDSPIEIQRLPIGFDWDVIEEYVRFLKRPADITEAVSSEMEKLHLIQKNEENIWELTVIGTLVANFLDRQPPFFETPFGYFIEHKLKEYYDHVYGSPNVIHGYKPKTVDGDIDLLIQETNGFKGIEIKPFSVLDTPNRLFGFMEKLLLRCEEAEKQLEASPKEFWLITYSFKQSGDPAIPKLSNETIDLLKDVSSLFADSYEQSIFKLKHLFVKPNKIDGKSNRILYHQFVRSSIKNNAVKTIFSSDQN